MPGTSTSFGGGYEPSANPSLYCTSARECRGVENEHERWLLATEVQNEAVVVVVGWQSPEQCALFTPPRHCFTN
jgi:hypothetical protein